MSEFNDVEPGDKIRFEIPTENFEDRETTGGVGEVGENALIAKAGGYYQVTPSNFVKIIEKGAFL